MNKAKLDHEANRNEKDGLIGTDSEEIPRDSSGPDFSERDEKEAEANAKSEVMSAQQARIDQLRVSYDLRRKQLDELNVRAGVSGVVQQVPVEAGQRVAPGTILAKVAEPGRLKAELQIAETQVKDIVVGQPASIDTRNGIIAGQVIRIDPAAVNGTVKIDVQLNGEYPKGVRPDLSVDGTIDLERLSNVLYVGRPAYGQAESTVGVLNWR
jgi:HlyD family secretion protein